jgi:hypothetical protein
VQGDPRAAQGLCACNYLPESALTDYAREGGERVAEGEFKLGLKLSEEVLRSKNGRELVRFVVYEWG